MASSSPYRKALMQRLQISFITINPDISESALPAESAPQIVSRLAREKVEKVAENEKNALIIGSDQVAVLEDCILGKPGNRSNAKRQLITMRDREVSFLTGLCVLNTQSGSSLTDVVSTMVSFRDYSDDEIEHYLDKESPFDCAGSFKSEQLGITLVKAISGSDPTSLIGLPLIRLAEMLRSEGCDIP